MQIVTVVFNGAWKGVSVLTAGSTGRRTVVRFLNSAAAAAGAVRVNGERHHPASYECLLLRAWADRRADLEVVEEKKICVRVGGIEYRFLGHLPP